MSNDQLMLFFCYLRNNLQNRSPHKCSGEGSDAFGCRRIGSVYDLAGVRFLEDKLQHQASILLLLTLQPVASSCTLSQKGRTQCPSQPFPFETSVFKSLTLNFTWDECPIPFKIGLKIIQWSHIFRIHTQHRRTDSMFF